MRTARTESGKTDRRGAVWLVVFAIVGAALALAACSPAEPTTPKATSLPANAYNPDQWQSAYPQEYADWNATGGSAGKGSKYKKGGEGDVVYDKLSEYPFLAAMSKGIGFSVEFNEPRGHKLAFTDQHKIDPARLKSGGVCLACKTPYWDKLREEQGDKLYSMPYQQAVNLIPAADRDLGVVCIDCHQTKDLTLRYNQLMADGLKEMGNTDPDETQMRNAVCGQCHSTYVIPKSKEGSATGLFLPWQGSKYGDISVENIISVIETDTANHEWTQLLTGLKLGYIRHPEFELYTRGDVHYRNGVTCVDCHQYYKVENGKKVSNHEVRSPLSQSMNACKPCHPGQSEQNLRDSVFHVQDNYIGQLLNAGYSVVANAQLIRMLNEAKIDTTTADAAATYNQAVDMYKQAFYRVAFSAGENSVGFHNPPEAQRILADALAYSQRADQILRGILAKNGIVPPSEVDLQLLTYLEDRGVRQLQFQPEQEFRDPRGVAEILWRKNLDALRSGQKTGGDSGTSNGTGGTGGTGGAGSGSANTTGTGGGSANTTGSGTTSGTP